MMNSSLGTAVVLCLSVAIFLKEGQCQGENGNIPNGNMANWASQYGGQNGANQNGGQMWPNQNNWQNWKNQYGGNQWNNKNGGKQANKGKNGKHTNNNGQNWAADWQKWASMSNGALGGTNAQWLKMAEQYMAQWNNNNGAVQNNGNGKKNNTVVKNNGNAEYRG